MAEPRADRIRRLMYRIENLRDPSDETSRKQRKHLQRELRQKMLFTSAQGATMIGIFVVVYGVLDVLYLHFIPQNYWLGEGGIIHAAYKLGVFAGALSAAFGVGDIMRRRRLRRYARWLE